MKEYRLTSNAMVYTPVVFAWMLDRFRTKPRKTQKALVEGYGIGPKTAWGLLKGTIPHEVRGDMVVFCVEDATQ